MSLRSLNPLWPLLAAIASALMLAAAHAFEAFGHLPPCELCLKQREVYWVALAVGLAGFALGRGLKRPLLLNLASLLLALIFLFGAGLAAYHAGVEWKWWPGPQACTGQGRATAAGIAALMNGARIAGPSCDVAAWRMAGLSMAGWNALISLVLMLISFQAIGRTRRRGLDPI